MIRNIQGIVPVMFTPFQEDGDIDSEHEGEDNGKVEEGLWFSHAPSLGSLQACASYAG